MQRIPTGKLTRLVEKMEHGTPRMLAMLELRNRALFGDAQAIAFLTPLWYNRRNDNER